MGLTIHVECQDMKEEWFTDIRIPGTDANIWRRSGSLILEDLVQMLSYEIDDDWNPIKLIFAVHDSVTSGENFNLWQIQTSGLFTIIL